MTTVSGETATFAAVRDELETLPFLAPRRLVVVEDADTFVSDHRPALEKYVVKPAATGVLVLDVKTWPATTRLSKMIDQAATIVCKGPASYRIPDWCVKWASSQHGKQLSVQGAHLLVELVGADMGLLDQELNKLALYVGTANRIDVDDVDKLVGHSRAENTWKIFDAIGNAKVGEALKMVGRLLDQGEDPIGLLGAFSWQLRRLAQAARRAQQGKPLSVALQEVGFKPFALQGPEQQIRHLGLRRLGKLYDWLLEMDLDLKGSSQLSPRILLERLVVRLATPRQGNKDEG